MEYKGKNNQDTLFSFNLTGSTQTLESINQIYELIYPLVEKRVLKMRPLSKTGRPPYHPELLFKMLFLGHLYGLSDRKLIECIHDRISFRRFLRVYQDEEIPDRKLLVEFRSQFFGWKTPEVAMNRLFDKLKKQGLMVKGGSIVDSTIVEAPGKKTPDKKKRDKSARYTKKHNITFFGYKLHIAVSAENKLISKGLVTPAHVPDINMTELLIRKQITSELYGDKGYTSSVLERSLEAEGITPKLMRKNYATQPLSKEEERRNHVLSKTRARVEHVMGRLKNEFNLLKTRYFNLMKNRMSLLFVCVLYNAKQALRLKPDLLG